MFVVDARMKLQADFWQANYARLLKIVRPDHGAHLLHTDGSVKLIGFGKLRLPQVYRALNCDTVDVVRLPNPDGSATDGGLVMIVDDNGLLSGSFINPIATTIVNCLHGGNKGSPIVGAVIIASDEQF